MIRNQIKDAANEIISWLQDAVGDVAYSMDEEGDDKWNKRIKKAKRNGVTDIKGWLADELYNDVGTLCDMTGDRIHDAGKGDKKAMITIAEKIKEGGHRALRIAIDLHIKRWQK